MDGVNRGLQSGYRKIYIQRDYSEGTEVRFNAKFPPELDGKIEKGSFEFTVSELNRIYMEAESLSKSTVCEGCMACLTAYLIYICIETHYEKCMKRIKRFLNEQNKTVYNPKGLHITDPIERGLRVIEITVEDNGISTRT